MTQNYIEKTVAEATERQRMAGKASYEAFSATINRTTVLVMSTTWDSLDADIQQAWADAALAGFGTLQRLASTAQASGTGIPAEDTALQRSKERTLEVVDDMTDMTDMEGGITQEGASTWTKDTLERVQSNPDAKITIINGACSPERVREGVDLQAVWPKDRLSAATTAASIQKFIQVLVDAALTAYEGGPPAAAAAHYAASIKDLTAAALEWHHMSKGPEPGR